MSETESSLSGGLIDNDMIGCENVAVLTFYYSLIFETVNLSTLLLLVFPSAITVLSCCVSNTAAFQSKTKINSKNLSLSLKPCDHSQCE